MICIYIYIYNEEITIYSFLIINVALMYHANYYMNLFISLKLYIPRIEFTFIT